MHFVHEVINYIASQPASTWTTLASYLGGSTLVATILQIAKHKLNFATAEKMIVFVLGFLSFLAAFADFLIQSNPTLSALPFIGHATGLLMAGAVIVHRFAVSPAYYSLNLKLTGFGKLLKEAEAEQLHQPEVPADVLNSVPVTAPVAALVGSLPTDQANLTQFQV